MTKAPIILWVLVGICMILWGVLHIPVIGLDPVKVWAIISAGFISAGILCFFQAKGPPHG